MPRLLTALAALLFLCPCVPAQSSPQDFDLGGSAYILNDECIRLTPDRQYASGSAWYKEPINLAGPFQMTVCLVLGEKDELGADGIVFVFHPRPNTGYRGEGMGFSGLRPSLGIEFDTYQNTHLDDPAEDHLAVMTDGWTWHGASVLGPIKLPNLEDGQKHLLEINWDPIVSLLTVKVDKELRASYRSDIVNEIFGGNSTVYWGATAATGRKSNYQDLCIKKLFFAGVE